ncbi:acyl carrier protein [uncultured Eubacterium sp.]|uniref:acyl carrier protein n=1 Tax=uncultured Eubacterium sp. TaxID=165185 RepID=UPI002671445C|nr:phosphopantetheine-binding protein [uncultured Eubacterium sp.]
MSVKNEIISILDSMCIILIASDEDIDLTEYIVESIQFINFIVELEQKFGIEIPSNMLMIDNLGTLSGVVNLVESLIDESRNGNYDCLMKLN